MIDLLFLNCKNTQNHDFDQVVRKYCKIKICLYKFNHMSLRAILFILFRSQSHITNEIKQMVRVTNIQTDNANSKRLRASFYK